MRRLERQPPSNILMIGGLNGRLTDRINILTPHSGCMIFRMSLFKTKQLVSWTDFFPSWRQSRWTFVMRVWSGVSIFIIFLLGLSLQDDKEKEIANNFPPLSSVSPHQGIIVLEAIQIKGVTGLRSMQSKYCWELSHFPHFQDKVTSKD